MSADDAFKADRIIQRVIMPLTGDLTRLYYHCDHAHEGTPSLGRRTIRLPHGSTLRTDTWFNAFFERYWRKYTNLDELEFRACVSGVGTLRLYRRSTSEEQTLLREIDFSGELRELRIEIADTRPSHQAAGLLFFEIVAAFHRALFFTEPNG